MTKDALVLLVILFIVGAFFFPLFYPTPSVIVTPDFGLSDAVTGFSTKYFLWLHLQQNHIPLWTTQWGGGFPIYAQGGMSALFIPNLILYKLFDPVHAYNLSIVLSLSILGWGMYAWLRLLKQTRFASCFGGITAALSGYSIVQLTHISIIQGLSLFPLLCAMTYLLTQTYSWTVVGILAVTLSQQLIIGFPQTVFITLLFLTSYVAWIIRAKKKKLFAIIQYIIALVLGFGLSAIQLLPSNEFLTTIQGSKGFSADTATLFSYPLVHLKTLLDPFALGNPKLGTYPPFYAFGGSIFWENTAYIGIVPLIAIILATLFFFLRKTKKPRATGDVLFFVGVLVVSFLLATGGNSPLYLIYSFWPFSIFRVPSRFIWLFIMSLIVLSVKAIDSINKTCSPRFWRFVIAILIILHVAQIFSVWQTYHAIVPASQWTRPPTLLEFIPKQGYLLTLGAETTHNATYLKKGWQDTRPYDMLRNAFGPDKNLLWGVANFRENAGRSLRRSTVINSLIDASITSDIHAATISDFGSKLLNLFAVSSVISTVPLTQTGLTSHASFSYDSQSINLFDNPHAVPKAYIASSAAWATTAQEAAQKMKDPSFVAGSTVLLEQPVSYPTVEKPGVVSIRSSQDERIVIAIRQNPAPSILVVADTYYPGWHATVDGKETNIFPVNIKQKGMWIPKGDHTVVLYYLPQSLVIGAVVSVLFALLTILVMGFARFLPASYTDQKVLAIFWPHRRSRGRSPPHTR